MNTYQINFERENGTVGEDKIIAATEAQAKRDFREIYRHGTITNVECICTGTPATIEQERKALEKIKKIVEELGEGSYIGTAFAGCFEIAESNIENDFADSMKEKYEQAQEDAAHFRTLAEELQLDIDRLREENKASKEKSLTTAEAGAIKAILHQTKLEASRLRDESAQRIVEFADTPDSQEFQRAVQDNRRAKKQNDECERLISRLLETMG